MGFTDRMGDVLAAADALIHSSAGLTVLEAIIRGCPVISYGFGVRPRARVATARWSASGSRRSRATQRDLGPALERALAHRPEPDGSFARRPSTASLILADERRARQLPALAAADRRARSRPRRPWSRSPAGRLTTGASVQPRLALRAHAPGHRGHDRPARGRRAGRRARRRTCPRLAERCSRRAGSTSRSRSSRPRRSPKTATLFLATVTRRCRGCPAAGSSAGCETRDSSTA